MARLLFSLALCLTLLLGTNGCGPRRAGEAAEGLPSAPSTAIADDEGTGSPGEGSQEGIPDLRASAEEDGMGKGEGATRRARLNGVKSWVYVLQGNDPDRIASANADLVVTDYGDGGSRAFSPEAVARMKNGGKTRVLAYVSIGEAEDWRFYDMPACAGPENPDWPGCRWVAYWDGEWEKILLGAGGYLDQILEAGFDGIYMDKVDAYREVPEGQGVDRDEACKRMIALVGKIAAHCRAKRPEFLLFPQNAPELFRSPSYAACCDGIGQEECWYAATDEARDDAADTEKALSSIRSQGKLVLTVDYCRGDRASKARARSRQLGFVPFTTGDVDLNGLP